MVLRKKGFTLVELLAVIVILGVLIGLVAPSIFSIVKKSREDSYKILINGLEDNARLYTTRHKDEVTTALTSSLYYTITLDDLITDDLLSKAPIDPRTNEEIDLAKKFYITANTEMYLDICFEDRGCYIPTSLVNVLTAEGKVVSGTTEGLHYDSTNSIYYFRGQNPDNWLEFNDYLWRIIKINSDNSIKLIFEGRKSKNGTIENGFTSTSAFDSGNSNSYNNAVTIKTNLQTWYNNNIKTVNQKMVQNRQWCIGPVTYSTSGTLKDTFLSSECLQVTASSYPIGLIYGSEYLYASLDDICTTAYLATGDNGTSCKNNNYLYKSNYSYFTMTPTETTTDLWDVKNTGSLGIPVAANTPLDVRPVINLLPGTIVNQGSGTYDNPYTIKDIVNTDSTKPVITILGDNPVMISLGETYVDAGATALDDKDGDITSSITKMTNVNVNVGGNYQVTYVVSDSSGNRTTAVRNVTVTSDYLISKGVNRPRLVTGMTPIKWNGSAWVDTTVTDSDWYSYTQADKKWANAKTADGSMWVWIPRYVYKISSGWHSSTTGTIDTQFSIDTDDTRGGTVTLDTGTTANASNNKWTNQPSFDFGTTKLTGIWVGKFEASAAEGVSNTSADDVTTKTVKIIPNVQSWRYISVGHAYTNARNMETNNTYGWGTSGTGIDTHIMKNTEWGTVAYLAQSIYGKNAEVWTNPANNYTTGCAGDSVSSADTAGCLRTYNTANGQQASTTGNIYGIYDMSGGAWEYVASYVNNGSGYLNGSGSSVISANDKYKNVYTVTTDNQTNNYANAIDKKGDAIYETSNSGSDSIGWYGDYSYIAVSDNPWFIMGGYCCELYTKNGLFGFGAWYGDWLDNITFRPIIAVDESL